MRRALDMLGIAGAVQGCLVSYKPGAQERCLGKSYRHAAAPGGSRIGLPVLAALPVRLRCRPILSKAGNNA
jgi:hypothetical protein